MNALLSALSWLGAYLVVVTAPLFVLLLGPVPPPGGFWWDFAMALGFAALAMMGVQFILTARFRRATMPFGIALIGHVRLVRPWLTLRKPYRVAEVRRERGDAYTLVLEPEGHAGMRFAPGQFAWLTLGASPFALKEHPFSIASSAARAGTIQFGIKAVGDFTRSAMNVSPGQKAFLDGAYGAFSTDRHPRAPGYVFVAGGVGIAPIMCMLRTLADRGDRRPLLLFYGNRRWERALYREALDELAGGLNLRIVHILGEPPEGWRGECGMLTQAMLDRHLPAHRTELHYFLCGPAAMTQSAEKSLAALGIRSAQIHSELFEWV